jgi:acyl-CoA synthetase (AMP-forming)/AMP-acid ligase II
VANLVAHISGVMQSAGVQPGDRVLQWIAMYFDMTVLDFWTPLALGCAIVVAPAEEMKDVERVATLVQQHQIASISMVPSMCQVSAAVAICPCHTQFDSARMYVPPLVKDTVDLWHTTQVLADICRESGVLSSLRHVNCGGEAVTPAAVAAMCAVAPNAEIHDTYGALWSQAHAGTSHCGAMHTSKHHCATLHMFLPCTHADGS